MSSDALVTEPIVKKRRNPWLNIKILSAAAILIIAVGFLIFNAVDGAGAYYMTVDEIASSTDNLEGEQIKVGGDVVGGSIVRGDIGEDIRFEITDGSSIIPVVYNGAIPDIFSDDVQVIATGTIRSDGVFEANELLTKCPSRFEAEEGVSN